MDDQCATTKETATERIALPEKSIEESETETIRDNTVRNILEVVHTRLRRRLKRKD